MTTSVAERPKPADFVGTLAQVLSVLLRPHPVDAALVSFQHNRAGLPTGDADIYLVVNDHGAETASLALDIEDTLSERFPGVGLAVRVRAHQGRRNFAALVPGAQLVYSAT